MVLYNKFFEVGEKIRAKMSVDEFLKDNPSIFEIQAYVQMARNDLIANPGEIYAKEVIKLLSGE
jgi:hypothetical protein